MHKLGAMAMLLSLPLGGCIPGFRQPAPSVSEIPGGSERISATIAPSDSAPRHHGGHWPAKAKASPPLEIPPAPSETVSDEPALIMPAVALEESATKKALVLTAGIFDKPADAVKQGVNKVADAITPTPAVTPADDPTLLSTKSKPTPELHLSMAKFYEESGKPAAAEQSYQQALRMAPKHLGAHLAYARFKERQGETREAIQWCQRAARIYPNEAAVFNDLGLICARHGLQADALAAYRRAIELQPQRALYRNNIAVLLVDMGRADQALTHLSAVYAEPEAYYKLGYLLQAKGEIHQAKDAFSRAVALNPSMKEARLWLQHLQAEHPATASVSPRSPDASERIPSPRTGAPSAREPSRGGPTWQASQPPAEDSAMVPRVGSKPLPQATRPLPEPPVRRLPEAEPSPSQPENLVPWPRRLPPVTPEKPIGFEESVHDLAPAARTLALTIEEPTDAPMPTAESSGQSTR